MTFPEHWVIGLFEGEGSIIISKRYNTAYLKIKSTDLDVLEKVQSIMGGKIYSQPVYEGRKPAWDWVFQKKKLVAGILMNWLPFLSSRRAYKALNALDRIDGI